MGFDSLDFISRANPDYVDQLYQQYQQDPSSVEEQWAIVFAGYEFGLQAGSGLKKKGPVNPPGVYDLIHSYRELGHLIADIDPLREQKSSHPLLEVTNFGFDENDLNRTVDAGSFRGMKHAPLKVLIRSLQHTYCRTVGVEFMHLIEKEQRDWLLDRMEPTHNHPPLNSQERRLILRQLIFADEFEKFLHTKYLGSKRFSLEGNLSLIPLLNALVEHSVSLGTKEFVLGMPHRGRLNVLAHLMHKPYERILAEFEGLQEDEDVKYHLGYSHDLSLSNGKTIHLSLSNNPSHLEAVNPVVLGMVHAKQNKRSDADRNEVIPVLMHGDAAFTGQGIVYETLGLVDLEGYSTGGTIHIIINNQIGFTTDPEQGRSTRYASDLAKITNTPIFHVNAEDPEAVIWAAQLAIGFRQAFKSDVLIDLIGFRRHGHNEMDDATFTQPLMYSKIKQKPSVAKFYTDRLIESDVIDAEYAQNIIGEIREELEHCQELARQHKSTSARESAFGGLWEGLGPSGEDWSAETTVDADRLEAVAKSLPEFPEAFTPHSRIPKLFEQMRDLVLSGEGLHWAAGETLAYGSLLLEGTPIRLTGQDCERGTFSHRHAVLNDAETGDKYVPLNHLSTDQAKLDISNSPLHEAGALGFEYGVSSANPNLLTIWEAQFGDFANGAQVIIDQFITSGEVKWARQSGLVMLLPHGYEGQGPEHSSARLERFLQLAAEDNIQVVNCTTPAQFFHVLRRQIHRNFRKPLIVMTPKSLLRHKRAVSALSEFTEQGFQKVLADPIAGKLKDVRRVLMCSGKIYYDLEAQREEQKINNIAIIRLEQLYPFAEDMMKDALADYADAEMVWVQEEPKNQGAWTFVQPHLQAVVGKRKALNYIGRPASASPATGSLKIHQREQEELLNEALTLPKPKRASKKRVKQKTA